MLINKGINITLNGNIQQVTSSGIATCKMVFVNTGSNTLWIGHTASNNTAPTTLDDTHCEYSLAPGVSVTIGQEERSYWIGENYILSHWYVKGTNTQTCRVTYVGRRTSADPI